VKQYINSLILIKSTFHRNNSKKGRKRRIIFSTQVPLKNYRRSFRIDFTLSAPSQPRHTPGTSSGSEGLRSMPMTPNPSLPNTPRDMQENTVDASKTLYPRAEVSMPTVFFLFD